MKAQFKKWLPQPVKSLLVNALSFAQAERKASENRKQNQRVQRQYQSLTLEDTFQRIYTTEAWGGAEGSSGVGSTGRYVQEYAALLKQCLERYRIQSVADLGCGNFNTGRVVAPMVERYIGVDIAPPVVEANARAFATERVQFVRADLTKDALPPAQAAIVRQVLQHLTNDEIRAALANILGTYLIAFITEHVYVGRHAKPNRDFGHGPGTRIPLKSGVFIDQPPFNVRAEHAGDIVYAPNEVLRTWVARKT